MPVSYSLRFPLTNYQTMKQTRPTDPLAVIFDLGGVLLDWDPRYLYRMLFDDETEMEYFLTEVCPPAWNARQDAGRPFAEGVAEAVERYPRYRTEIEAYAGRWDEMLKGPIEGTVDILSELRRGGHHLSALSNWSTETFPVARRRYGFLEWFEHIVLSGEEKMIKPDSGIYHRLLERTGLAAQSCIFIDDSVPNVEAADALGFTALHFESPERLRGQLSEHGISL